MDKQGSGKPTVSVVVPVYNDEQLVVAALESVLAHSFSDCELIMVDDYSLEITQTCASDCGIMPLRNARNLRGFSMYKLDTESARAC